MVVQPEGGSAYGEHGQTTDSSTCDADWSTVGLAPVPAKDFPSENECKGTAAAAQEVNSQLNMPGWRQQC